MGYNLEVACHTCRETCGAIRGEESMVIRRWAERYSNKGLNGHRFDVVVGNGWSGREFPAEHRNVYVEVMAGGLDLAADELWQLSRGGTPS